MIAMHKGSHPRDDIDTPYVTRKEGERELTSMEDCVDASIKKLEECVNKNKEKLIIAACNTNNYGSTKLKKNNNKITK